MKSLESLIRQYETPELKLTEHGIQQLRDAYIGLPETDAEADLLTEPPVIRMGKGWKKAQDVPADAEFVGEVLVEVPDADTDDGD